MGEHPVSGRTTKYFRWRLYADGCVIVERKRDKTIIAGLTPGDVWRVNDDAFAMLDDDEIIELLKVTSGWLTTAPPAGDGDEQNGE